MDKKMVAAELVRIAKSLTAVGYDDADGMGRALDGMIGVVESQIRYLEDHNASVRRSRAGDLIPVMNRKELLSELQRCKHLVTVTEEEAPYAGF